MDWAIAADIATVFGAILAGTGGLGAFITYRRSLRTRRSEWLGSLHRQFFESEKYDRIRSILYYQIEPQYSALSTAVREQQYHELVMDLWRYLNFFELIASLHSVREISLSEAAGLFDYDLQLIGSRSFIVERLEAEGFRHLPRILRQLNVPLNVPSLP